MHQWVVLKNNIKIYIKIYIKTAPTYYINSPTDAPMSCLKSNIKIYSKTAPTCFGVTVTLSSGSALICAY